MDVEVTSVEMSEILPLRDLHRQQMNCQIVHDSFPQRGLSDAYRIRVNGRLAGYGLVANKYHKDSVDEFYVVPGHRAAAALLFRAVIDASRATRIRAQTNDPLLSTMLYAHGRNITSESVIFDDGGASQLSLAYGALSRDPAGDGESWRIEHDGATIATGGLLFHYNPPFADIYMDVDEAHRRRGFGSYLVQELRRISYEIGHVPAARCNIGNLASQRTLQRGGLRPCGHILTADLADPVNVANVAAEATPSA